MNFPLVDLQSGFSDPPSNGFPKIVLLYKIQIYLDGTDYINSNNLLIMWTSLGITGFLHNCIPLINNWNQDCKRQERNVWGVGEGGRERRDGCVGVGVWGGSGGGGEDKKDS